MERFRTLVLCVCLAVAVGLTAAAVSMAATSDDAAPVPAPVPVEAKEAPAEEKAVGGLAATVGQVQAMAYAWKQEAREKRLGVLKRLEAGEITAEEALAELDELPASPAYFRSADKPSAWLVLSINQDGQEVYVSLPLTLVRWLIAEAPKMIPEAYKTGLKEQGFDIEALNLMGLAMVVDAFGQVEKTTQVLRIKQGSQEIVILVEPGAPMD